MIAAAVNRWVWYGLLGVGIALVAFGLYLGLFAWANDGFVAGVGVFGVSASFGLGAVLAGLAFRLAAAAHAARRPRRWWIQLLPVVTAYLAFGLAATLSSLLEKMSR